MVAFLAFGMAFVSGYLFGRSEPNGGPLAFLKNGDPVTIDADNKELKVEVNESDCAKRKACWVKPPPRESRGVLAKYAKTVHSASEGAITS